MILDKEFKMKNVSSEICDSIVHHRIIMISIYLFYGIFKIPKYLNFYDLDFKFKIIWNSKLKKISLS